MRVTIFGASGLLGQALMREWSKDAVIGLGSRDADIRDAKRVQQLVRETNPEWIVLSAAYTDVDGCESNPDLAFAVNRDGAVNVAVAGREAGARLLFLSSDYVFDGKKTTPYETDDCPESAERIRTNQGGGGDQTARVDAGLLHRENVVAVWCRWNMFPRHDLEARREPSGAGCGQRPAWLVRRT